MVLSTRSPNSSEQSSKECSHPPSISTSPEADKKIGRPSRWTDSRQRKLARLYLYTNLPPKDIRQALHDETDNWLPEKETTTKAFNAMLNKDPRWLRPKNQEEMDHRIQLLADCKEQRDLKRQLRQTRLTNHSDIILEESVADVYIDLDNPLFVPPNNVVDEVYTQPMPSSNNDWWTEFTQTPLQDLLNSNPLGVFDDSLDDLWRLVDINRSANEDGHASSKPTQSPINAESGKHKQTDAPRATDLIASPPNRQPLHTDGITDLLQAYSLCGSSAASTTDMSRRYSAVTMLSLADKSATRSHPTEIALPSAFLVADIHRISQGPCFPGLRAHDAGICWCMLDLELLPQGMRWQANLEQAFYDSPSEFLDLSIRLKDAFGNSILHFLAARGVTKLVILQALRDGADGNAKNAAGQTFLHCFHFQYFIDLAISGTLISFLRELIELNVNFEGQDHFGRRMAHLFVYEARNFANPSLIEAADILNRGMLSTRDAFGWTPLDSAVQLSSSNDLKPSEQRWRKDPWINHDAHRDLSHEAPLDFGFPPRTRTRNHSHKFNILPSTTAEILIATHARLLETAALALAAPWTEDSQGRNGLHCLAEASFDLHKVTDVLHSGAKASSNKRKRDHIESGQGTFKSGMDYRFELVRQMVKAGVDINNYDKLGNTVFMAFVIHLDDGDDGTTLSALLRYLISEGANVHRRNRQGETALHIAVRLGHKIATAVLLDEGANVHARTLEGKGVLAIGERHYFEARSDPQLYASIMACLALCIHYGAVARPTPVQEWSTRSSQAPRRILKV